MTMVLKLFVTKSKYLENYMDFTHLKYIKNVTSWDGKWAYKYGNNYYFPLTKNSYFRLNFHASKDNENQGVENHAKNLQKGSFIILSQNNKIENEKNRYLTHIVELVNEGYEDEPQWYKKDEDWKIFRWVKVHWIADFNNIISIPVDKEIMKVNWGYQGTLAKSLSARNLMNEWGNIDNLRNHLQSVFRPLT